MLVSTNFPRPVRARSVSALRMPTTATRAPNGTASTKSGGGGTVPGRLDPEDVSAQVGEHPGAERTGLEVGEIEHPQRCERPALRIVVGHVVRTSTSAPRAAGYACQRSGVSSMKHTISSTPRN